MELLRGTHLSNLDLEFRGKENYARVRIKWRGSECASPERKIRIKKLEASSLYDSGLLRECQTNAQAQPRGQEVRRKRERWKWWWRNFMPSTVVHASRGCERYEGEKIEAGHSGVEDGSGAGGAEDSFPGPGKAREPAAARSPGSGRTIRLGTKKTMSRTDPHPGAVI